MAPSAPSSGGLSANELRNELRAARRALATASDVRIAEVVALMDRVSRRGEIDALLDPIRGRLARLRPPRPLRFERLLFLPLDPVIVPARAWRPGDPTIPRPIIVPLAHAVRIALGAQAQVIDALIAGRTRDDTAVVEAAGALLWPGAARILAQTTEPPGWQECGLSLVQIQPLVTAVAAVLAWQAEIDRLAEEARGGRLDDGPAGLGAVINGLISEPPDTRALLLSVLIAHLPDAAPLLRALESPSRGVAERAALRQAGDSAATALINRLDARDGVENRIASLPLTDAPAELRRLGLLTMQLLDRTDDPRQRARLYAIRQRLDAASRVRFAAAMQDELLTPLATARAACGEAWHAGTERAARALRMLETEGRRIGSAGIYDALLAQASSLVARMAATGAMTKRHAVRLTELLAGPDAAMALLERD